MAEDTTSNDVEMKSVDAQEEDEEEKQPTATTTDASEAASTKSEADSEVNKEDEDSKMSEDYNPKKDRHDTDENTKSSTNDDEDEDEDDTTLNPNKIILRSPTGGNQSVSPIGGKASPTKNAATSVENAQFEADLDENRSSRFEFLLKQTELFSHFMSTGASAGEVGAGDGDKKKRGKQRKVLNEKEKLHAAGEHRHVRTEQEEDEELLEDSNKKSGAMVFTESPPCRFWKSGKKYISLLSFNFQISPAESYVTTKSVVSIG